MIHLDIPSHVGVRRVPGFSLISSSEWRVVHYFVAIICQVADFSFQVTHKCLFVKLLGFGIVMLLLPLFFTPTRPIVLAFWDGLAGLM